MAEAVPVLTGAGPVTSGVPVLETSTTWAFLNPILTPAAQRAVAADPTIVSTLLLVLSALGIFAFLSWYIGFATGKGKIIRDQAKEDALKKKKGNNTKAPTR